MDQRRIAVIVIACIVGVAVYIHGVTVWPVPPPPPPPPPPPDGEGAGQQLTFLDSAQYAFTISPRQVGSGSWYVHYDFGSTIPSNTVMALCLIKLTDFSRTGGSDLGVSLDDLGENPDVGGRGTALYSIGADNDDDSHGFFRGTFFCYFPVENRGVYCSNEYAVGGYANPIEVFVVGYITQETSGNGFYMDFSRQDYPVVSSGSASSWTDINLNSIVPQHSGMTLKGVYIAVDRTVPNGAGYETYFRRNGDTGDGVAWSNCLGDPGKHLIGWIPVSNNGFQYRVADSRYPVNIWVEGFVFECSAGQGDRFEYQSNMQVYSVINSWTTSPSYSSYKAVFTLFLQSPGQMNTCMVRPSGASNNQLWYKKNSCGGISILTGLGSNSAFDYWKNPSGSGAHRQFVGSIVLRGSQQ